MFPSIFRYTGAAVISFTCLFQTNAFQWSTSPRIQSHIASKPNITSIQQQIQGTWKLTSYEIQIHGPWTMKRYPLGKDTIGLILYTSDGYMSAQLMMPGSPLFTAGSIHQGSSEELAGAAKHYMAYSGPYSVGIDGNGKPSITHSVEVSLYPNWLHTNQTRICELGDGELTLSPNELYSLNGLKVEAVLKWKKVGGKTDGNEIGLGNSEIFSPHSYLLGQTT